MISVIRFKNRFKNGLRIVLGRIAARAMPHLVREIEAGVQTGRDIRLKRWILFAHTRAAVEHGSEADISSALQSQWRSEIADDFYDKYADRFEEWFLGPHQIIVDEMVRLQAEMPFRRLVEVGCGDGRVLAHCAERMPEIPECVGVDINPTIIARNSKTFAAAPRLRFVAGNAESWLAREAGPATLLFSYGGVLEYFDPAALRRIFSDLAGNPGPAVALVEPVAPGHDLDNNTRSYNFGQERSFSHNHAALLSQAGFTVRYRSEIQLGGVRWMMLLARMSGDGGSGVVAETA